MNKSTVKTIVIMILMVILGLWFKFFLYLRAESRGESVYEISLDNNSWMCTNWTQDPGTGCIKFKDLSGIKHVICDNYTITKWTK